MNRIIKLVLFFVIFTSFVSSAVAKQKPLLVVLDWFINPNHAPLFIAEQEGFFKDQGIEVQFISPVDATQGEKMVAAKKADIAISYQPSLVRYVVRGLPLVRFATLINTPLNCFVFLENGKIKTVKDLKGKRVGYSTLGDDSMMLNVMLRNGKLSTKDINMINVKFNLIQALLANRIDGFMGGMRNFEPLAIEIEGKSAGMFYPEDYGFPKYDELIFVVHKDKTEDPRLIKFAQVLKLGVRELKKNPQKGWEKFIRSHPELNNSLNNRAWFVTLQYFADDPIKLDKEQYRRLTAFMYKEKLISYMPQLEDYAM